MLDTHLASSLEAASQGLYADPRPVHDAFSRVMSDYQSRNVPVPSELRRIVDELEAEIVETYFDNMPI